MTEPTPTRRRFPKRKPPGTALVATVPKDQLSPADEKQRLGELEDIIRRGQRTFVEVGSALVEIRERRLYRHRGYRSFEEYLYERWDGMSKSYANRQIEAANTQVKLAPIGVVLPNEHTARLVKPYVGELTLRVKKDGQPPVAALHAVLDQARTKPTQPQPPASTPDDNGFVRLTDKSGQVKLASRNDLIPLLQGRDMRESTKQHLGLDGDDVASTLAHLLALLSNPDHEPVFKQHEATVRTVIADLARVLGIVPSSKRKQKAVAPAR
jgi:hypothetical protein